MGNIFVELPSPSGNGVGTAVDMSGFGAVKTIVVQGSWPAPLKAPTVNIEMNNDASHLGTWAPVCTFRGTGIITVVNAAAWYRVRLSGFTGGQVPDVNVGGTDDGAFFAALPVPTGNGTGAAVDVSGLPISKTLQIGNRFSGAMILELAEDSAGTEWAEWEAVQAPGQLTNIAAAWWARIKRVGVPTNDPYGVPIATLGATLPAGSGGGGGGGGGSIAIQNDGNPLGAFTTINILPGFIAEDSGGGITAFTVATEHLSGDGSDPIDVDPNVQTSFLNCAGVEQTQVFNVGAGSHDGQVHNFIITPPAVGDVQVVVANIDINEAGHIFTSTANVASFTLVWNIGGGENQYWQVLGPPRNFTIS